MTAGLRRAYLRVLTPAAALAPLPLIWTGGSSVAAIAGYETVLLWLAWRARGGRPVRFSNATLNLLGLLYLGWLGFETVTLRVGLLRSVSHLLLFTALAKLASLKRPSEARMALLVLFLLTLAAASSSTHVSSLVYFAVMAWLSFRTLARLAVLADFDDAPPDRVLDSVPTHGLTLAAIAGGLLFSAPLFFLLPRLHGPFAVAPFRIDDAFSTAMASDRVDLDAFSAAKRSDRVILRLSSSPPLPAQDELRLREAVFTEYNDGVWVRDPRVGPRRGEKSAFTLGGPAPERPLSVVTIDLNVYGQGFLFLPYGAYAVRVERGRASEMQDGVMQVGTGRGSVRYETDVRRAPARGGGRGVIPVSDVPEEVRRVRLHADRGHHQSRGDLSPDRGPLPQGLRLHARAAQGPERRPHRPLPQALEGRALRVLRLGRRDDADDARRSRAARDRLLRGRGGTLLEHDRGPRAQPPRLGRGRPRRDRLLGSGSHAAGRHPAAADQVLRPLAAGFAGPRDRVPLRPADPGIRLGRSGGRGRGGARGAGLRGRAAHRDWKDGARLLLDGGRRAPDPGGASGLDPGPRALRPAADRVARDARVPRSAPDTVPPAGAR